MSPSVPTQIGRYQIVRSLGEGGMGAVFLARDPAIDRHVAIKLMRSGFDDHQLRERFQREARSVGRLHHPNIVTVFDVGEHDGEPFIAMEYVEGQTLSHVIRHPEIGAFEARLDWIDGICAGLAYAHRGGVIHRDIKPANIMIETEGGVKILDFGIARATGSGAHTVTQSGTVLGTLNYMSPEQLSGRPVDHRTDIFSAGALFYELLSGKMAFPGDIQSGVLHYILVSGPVEPFVQACPGIHPSLAAVVNRCLAQSVDERYADFSAVRQGLAAARAEIKADSAPAPTIILSRDQPARPPSSGARGARTPGSETRAELLRLRSERLRDFLNQAYTALERDDLVAARDECRQALIIDPEHQPALELQDRIDAAERAQQWLADARQELARGQLTSAAALADRVLAVRPASSGAQAVRRGVEDARRRLEEIAERARALEAALAAGRAHLSEGRLDQASQAAAAARDLDSDGAEVRALQAQIAAALDARRRAEAEARARRLTEQAEAAVAQARARFAGGDREGALTMLRAHDPPHALVAEAIAGFERELADLARAADDARRAEAERQKADAQRREQEARARREEERRQAEARRHAEAEERRLAKAAEKLAREDLKRRQAAERAEARARETPLTPATSPGRSLRLSLMIGAGLAVGAAIWWVASRPVKTPVAAAPVSVLLDVRPWATIDRMTRASDGQAVDVACSATPCLVSLAPGTYHVRATNPFFAALDFDLTVGPGGPADVHQSFAGFSPDDEARKALEGR